MTLLASCGVKTEALGSCGKGFDEGVEGRLAKGFGRLDALDGELNPPDGRLEVFNFLQRS